MMTRTNLRQSFLYFCLLVAPSQAFIGVSTASSTHRDPCNSLPTRSSTSSFVNLLSSLSSSSAPTLEYLETVKEGVVEMGFDVRIWESCGSLLAEKTGMSLEEAQDALAKAWSWKSWAVTTSKIARKYIKPKEPSLSILEDALSWLEGEPLKLNAQEELSRAIRSDPVSYLVDPSTSYQKALKAAPPEFQDPSVFNSLLATKPEALKNYANCKEDGCNSECGNCWVSFKLKGDI
jgi:hypothetical protein